MWLFNIFSSRLAESIADAYQALKNAETQEAKLEAEKHIAWLQSQKEVIVSEQRRWLTAWIRPLIALPVVIYVWKLIVWDTVLQWGVTPDPGEYVNWIVLTVIGAYFLTRPFGNK